MFFSVERVEFERALSKQRNIDGERRVFQGQMDRSVFLFISNHGKYMDRLVKDT